MRLKGDGYYDSNWTNDILKNKILYNDKFYIPDLVNEFYSLLYHVLIHKNDFNKKYNNRLIRLSKKLDLKFSSDFLGIEKNDELIRDFFK